jgi:hypothetical protein
MATPPGGYLVFQQLDENEWRLLGEALRKPGLPARKSRGQALRDVLGREPEPGEMFAVLARSEWRNALEH